MRRSLLRLWLGSSAFAATLALGCSHGERVSREGVPAAVSLEGPEGPTYLAGGSVPTSYRLLPAVAASNALPPGPFPAPVSEVALAPSAQARRPAAIVRKVEWQVGQPPGLLRVAE